MCEPTQLHHTEIAVTTFSLECSRAHWRPNYVDIIYVSSSLNYDLATHPLPGTFDLLPTTKYEPNILDRYIARGLSCEAVPSLPGTRLIKLFPAGFRPNPTYLGFGRRV